MYFYLFDFLPYIYFLLLFINNPSCICRFKAFQSSHEINCKILFCVNSLEIISNIQDRCGGNFMGCGLVRRIFQITDIDWKVRMSRVYRPTVFCATGSLFDPSLVQIIYFKKYIIMPLSNWSNKTSFSQTKKKSEHLES